MGVAQRINGAAKGKSAASAAGRELLRRYVEQGDEEAFAELVGDHCGWVYSVCRRALKDRQLAEDTTQAVFLVLARRAHEMKAEASLGGWLFNTCRFAIAEARRRQRRQGRQQEAAKLAAKSRAPRDAEKSWERLLPELDEAVGRLSPRDRDAIVLYYFEQRTLAEVGEALGITHHGAKKRVERAVEKLRRTMGRHGRRVSAAGLASALLASELVAGEVGISADIAGAAMGRTLPSAMSEAIALGTGRAIARGALAALKAVLSLQIAAIVGLLVVYAMPRALPEAMPIATTRPSVGEVSIATSVGMTPDEGGLRGAIVEAQSAERSAIEALKVDHAPGPWNDSFASASGEVPRIAPEAPAPPRRNRSGGAGGGGVSGFAFVPGHRTPDVTRVASGAATTAQASFAGKVAEVLQGIENGPRAGFGGTATGLGGADERSVQRGDLRPTVISHWPERYPDLKCYIVSYLEWDGEVYTFLIEYVSDGRKSKTWFRRERELLARFRDRVEEDSEMLYAMLEAGGDGESVRRWMLESDSLFVDARVARIPAEEWERWGGWGKHKRWKPLVNGETTWRPMLFSLSMLREMERTRDGRVSGAIVPEPGVIWVIVAAGCLLRRRARDRFAMRRGGFAPSCG